MLEAHLFDGTTGERIAQERLPGLLSLLEKIQLVGPILILARGLHNRARNGKGSGGSWRRDI